MASLHTQGQPHDRILAPHGNGALDMPAEPNVNGKPVEVTTSMTQKMLSATTGSLLTSLLGMSHACHTRGHTFHDAFCRPSSSTIADMSSQ